MLHFIILICILTLICICQHLITKNDIDLIWINIILIVISSILIEINTHNHYSTYEHQKPVQRTIIKYNENNIPIDTIYIYPNI